MYFYIMRRHVFLNAVVFFLKTVIFYKKMVAEKRTYLPGYAFGEYIHKQYMMRNDWNMGKLLVRYRDFINNARPIPPISSDNPEEWNNAYKDLCKALNYVD